jgi:hypothetical protein
MKKCAELAGLIQMPGQTTTGSPFPLIIVLEPEAASIYSQEKLKKESGGSLKDNEPYLVVDAGGGTVDLVVHEKQGDQLRELSKGSGGTCGGSYVDESFLKLLSGRIGPVFDKWAAVYKTSLFELKRDWAMKKRSPNGVDDSAMLIKLPLTIVDVAQKEGVEVSYKQTLSPEDIKAIFDPVVDDIIGLIKTQLAAVPTCKTMLLVGGFSESPYLENRVKAAFKDTVPNIIRPPNPGSAIIQGAVLFGLNPRFVMNRISRKTYGIAVLTEFREGRDPPAKKLYKNGRMWCRDRFNRFVKVNQSIDVDQKVVHRVCPMDADQTNISIGVYTSMDPDPQYVTDKGMFKESEFFLDIPDTQLGLARSVEVAMSFGTTSIEVRAKGANFKTQEATCKVTGDFGN